MKPIRDPARTEERYRDFLRMRRWATAMLLVMAVIYVVARINEAAHPAIGYVRAFAEAGMVGGLADWFAVTALFRHPLGLPIPHTAIIARKKDQIGETLAAFLKSNFLTPHVIARQMRRLDVAERAGNYLSNPGGREGALRFAAARIVAEIFESLDKDRIGGFAKDVLLRELNKLNLAPLLANALEAAMREGKHRPLIDGVIRWSARTLESHDQVIRDVIHERAGSVMRWTGLDERLANAVISGLMKMLGEMAEDPHHPLRDKSEEALLQLVDDLRNDPKMQERVESWKREMLANPAIGDFSNMLWESARRAILRAANDPGGLTDGQLGETLAHIGNTLRTDPRLKMQVNRFTRRAAVGATTGYGDEIVALVSETVRRWDAATITLRVEEAVGRDLQFIRINGTLVGGMVGLCLHAIGHWLA